MRLSKSLGRGALIAVAMGAVAPGPAAHAEGERESADAVVAPASASNGELAPSSARAVGAFQPGDADLFGHVVRQARVRAEHAYREPNADIPETLETMDYAQYRGIRFRREAALWTKHSPFHVEFFHPGFLYEDPVTIHAVNAAQIRRLGFESSAFNYAEAVEGLDEIAEAAASLPSATGYAGFRVHYPLNNEDTADEVVVFLGASYFRLIGPGQEYGLSARGLAVDTAEPQGEEFPAFREFWLVRPDADANRLRIYALLDSPSVTGAYRFELAPGSETRVDVQARLFARHDVGKLGIAPLTSMFFYGENSARYRDDFRPEVHDSDGLVIHRTDGHWLWRPLTNPGSLRVTSHPGKAPRGFGLAQRDRDFDHYLDDQARYDRRPSLWVRPEGGWGKGRVELVEIPSASETNDNIVAYWVPAKGMSEGESRRYDYRLSTFGARRPGHDLARVLRTHSGWAAVPGASEPPPRRQRRFVVDFEGPRLARLGADLAVKPKLDVSNASVDGLVTKRLPDAGRWRVSFKLTPAAGETADMRLHLALRGERLTETWNYVWADDDRESVD